MNLILQRILFTPQFTLGRIFDISTIERPWNNGDNVHDTSCILPGKYDFNLFDSPTFGFKVPLLLNVPGRDEIEMHPDNFVNLLKGCIGVGTGFNLIEDVFAVEKSRIAFSQLMQLINGQPGTIEIINPPNF